MYKFKALFFMFVLILCACSAEKSPTTLEVTKMEEETYQPVAEQKLENEKYELTTKTYSKENVTIDYPQLSQLKDEDRQQQINELIEKEALAPFLMTMESLEPDQTYTAEGMYEIKLKSEHVLSIAYTCYNNISPSAHPYNLFFTTNIDVTTGEPLFLADFVSEIDEEFVAKLKEAKYVGELGDEFEQQIRELAFSQYGSDEQFISALLTHEENQIFVYVTEDALGISMPVAHVAGDHAEFEIEFSKLRKE